MAAIALPTASSLLEIYDVRAYGATGNGTTDDSAALQSAINAAGAAGGGIVYLPTGTYLINTAPTISAANVHVLGAGTGATNIVMANSTSAGWTISGSAGSLRNFTIGPKLTRSSGQYEFTFSSLNGYWIENIAVQSQGGTCWGVFQFQAPQSAAVFIARVYTQGPVRFLGLDSINDIYITQSIAFTDAPNGTPVAMIAAEGTGQVEALTVSDCDFISANSSNTCVIHSSNSLFAYNKFVNCYFDSAPIGVQIDNGTQLDFVSCWWSNRPGDGLVVNGGNNVHVIGGQAYNGGGRGFYLAGGWGHLVQGAAIVATGQSSASPAIQVGGSCTGARILGNVAAPSDYMFGGNISVGLLIDAGATYVLADQNDFHACTASVTNNSTASTVKIGTNL